MSPLGAIVRLGGSSAVAVGAAVAFNKTLALALGPDGVARYSLLQTIVTLAMIPASFGTAQALTRLGAVDAETGGPIFDGARRAAVKVRRLSGLVCAAAIVALGAPICDDLLRGQISRWELGMAVLAICATLVVSHDMALLSTAKRVASLARFTIVDAVAGTIAAALMLLAFGDRGVAPAVLVGALVALFLSRRTVARDLPPLALGRHPTSATGAVVRIGAPYTLAMLVGGAVSVAIPILALHLLSPRAVAYYQVSATVATGYLSFLMAAMAQDYFPRVSAASASELTRVVDDQQRTVLLVAMPVVLGTVVAAPLILHLAFSASFAPATTVLRWQVLSDTLRFSSWALSFAILARLPMPWFLMTESIGGAAMLIGTLVAVHFWGIAGLGIAWMATYAVYHVTVALVVARRLRHRHSSTNRMLLAAATLSLVAASAAIATNRSVLIFGIITPIMIAWILAACHILLPSIKARFSHRVRDLVARDLVAR